VASSALQPDHRGGHVVDAPQRVRPRHEGLDGDLGIGVVLEQLVPDDAVDTVGAKQEHLAGLRRRDRRVDLDGVTVSARSRFGG
jgi:hypothetical protein